MSILFMDGFEDGGFALKYNGYAGVSTTVTTRFGSGKALNLSASGSKYITKSFTAASALYVGMAFYPNGQAARDFLRFYGDSGVTSHLYIAAAGAAAPETMNLYRGNGTLLASYTGIKYGTWYYLEVSATIADSGGTCVVKLDGNTIINYTGDTKNAGTNTTIDTMRIGTTDWCGFNPYIDDLYISNSGFVGDSRIVTLTPSAAGSSTQLTPTGAASNYLCVNDQPDSTATYVSSGTTTHKDLYALSNLDAGASTVHGLQVGRVSKRSDTNAISMKSAILSGATTAYGATTALPASSGWTGDVWEVDPATSTAWTTSGVNGLEAGVEVV